MISIRTLVSKIALLSVNKKFTLTFKWITIIMNKLLIAATLLLCTNLALANHHEAGEGCKNMEKMDFSMKNMDADKDGIITKEEYVKSAQGDVEKDFKHIDANNDGKLDANEQKDVEEVLKAMHGVKTKTPVSTM
jgi:hypothetical protein